MAHFASGALLSGPINVLVERLAPDAAIMEFFRGKKDVVELLRELKSRLLSVHVVLNDAEEKQFTNPDVKAWLDEITDVISKTELLMDEIDTEDLGRKMEDESASRARKFLKFFSSSVHVFKKDVIIELKEILEELNLLSGQKDKLGLKLGFQNKPLQRSLAPLVLKESDVYGRDEDKEKIIKMLLSSDAGTGSEISVIPIVGMGGLGKTTLASVVYADRTVQKHFDLKAWVVVSVDFDVFQITKTIFEAVTGENCNIRDQYELQSKLNEALAGKKFLLVLDDVWNENYLLWEGLMSGFVSGARGSRIIVTTRSKVVGLTMGCAEVHELQLLSDEDCWLMFAKDVFIEDVPRTELLQEVGLKIAKRDNIDSKPQTELLQEVGREIVKRCKGLPLAVKSLAGLLSSTSNPEEWKKILNSSVWQLQSEMNLKNSVLPALWSSYQFLPPHLKRCFAYCSIFPKDYFFDEIDTKNLILLWMAVGFVQPEEGKRMEDVGEEYLHALIARSFFQYSSQRKPDIVMHDLVHDFATFIFGEFCFAYGDSNDSRYLGKKSCHLSYRKESNDLTKLASLYKTKSLRTLLALPLSSSYSKKRQTFKKDLLNELFQKVGGGLKVLSLSESAVKELPCSIGKLKHLRYLNLSGCTELGRLPDSIGTLFNLQTLLLSRCEKLEQLPSRITALVSLHHLDIRGTSLTEMPPQICKLKNLHTLSDFVLGYNGGGRIKELREFPLLGGSLCISGLENIVEVKDVLEGNLKDKKFLRELRLTWGFGSYITDSRKEREVFEALQPHTNLKRLTISGYKGKKFPNWVVDGSFCNMVEVIILCNCKNCCTLPPLGQLPFLRRLEMYHLDGVVSIGNEFCGSSSSTTNHPFRSLEHLEFRGMISWEKWSFCGDGLGQEGGVFRSLKILKISECNKLVVGLPDCYLPSLECISIVRCEEMVRVRPITTQEMDTTAFPSLQSLFVQNCPRMESLCFSSTLKVLGISYCEKLWRNSMNWDHLQRLSSLKVLRLGGIEVVDLFPAKEGLLPTTLTELSIHDFENLKGLNGRAFQHLISLQQLEISSCYRLECLPEEGLPLSLSYLRIYNCPLVKQRCQRGTGEDWPKIARIPHIKIEDQELW